MREKVGWGKPFSQSSDHICERLVRYPNSSLREKVGGENHFISLLAIFVKDW
jgi:hypothetical protein